MENEKLFNQQEVTRKMLYGELPSPYAINIDGDHKGWLWLVRVSGHGMADRNGVRTLRTAQFLRDNQQALSTLPVIMYFDGSTITHPVEGLTPENYQDLIVGNLVDSLFNLEGELWAVAKIYSPVAHEALIKGYSVSPYIQSTSKEIDYGLEECELVNPDHLAIVPVGRWDVITGTRGVINSGTTTMRDSQEIKKAWQAQKDMADFAYSLSAAELKKLKDEETDPKEKKNLEVAIKEAEKREKAGAKSFNRDEAEIESDSEETTTTTNEKEAKMSEEEIKKMQEELAALKAEKAAIEAAKAAESDKKDAEERPGITKEDIAEMVAKGLELAKQEAAGAEPEVVYDPIEEKEVANLMDSATKIAQIKGKAIKIPARQKGKLQAFADSLIRSVMADEEGADAEIVGAFAPGKIPLSYAKGKLEEILSAAEAEVNVQMSAKADAMTKDVSVVHKVRAGKFNNTDSFVISNYEAIAKAASDAQFEELKSNSSFVSAQ